MLAKAGDPLVQMPALHLHEPPGCRDRRLGQEARWPEPVWPVLPQCSAGAIRHRFFPLLRGHGNDLLMLRHGNILLKIANSASLIQMMNVPPFTGNVRGTAGGRCLGPGQEHDITRAEELLAEHHPKAVIADKGYDADELVQTICQRGAQAVIPRAAIARNPANSASDDTGAATWWSGS